MLLNEVFASNTDIIKLNEGKRKTVAGDQTIHYFKKTLEAGIYNKSFGVVFAVIEQYLAELPEEKDYIKELAVPLLEENRTEIMNWIVYCITESDFETIDIVHEVVQALDFDLHGLSEIISQHKSEILQTLIKRLKYRLGQGYPTVPIRKTLERLEKLGIHWPEIAIIKKSLEKELKESDDDDWDDSTGYDFPASEVMDRIGRKERLALNIGVQDMQYEGVPYSVQKGCLVPHAKEIADFIDYTLSEPNDQMMVSQFINFLPISKNWPEIKVLVNKHKGQVLWYLLKKVKEFMQVSTYKNGQTVSSIIKLLEEMEVNWPEVSIIKQTLEKEAARGKNREINEHDDEVRNEFTIKSIDAALKKGDIKSAVGLTMGEVNFYDKSGEFSRKYIAPMLIKHRKKILKWLEEQAQKVFISNIVGVYDALTKIGVELPEIIDVINSQKTPILTAMLSRAKKESGFLNAIPKIESMKKLGVNWPEFDIILKAHKTNKPLQENHSSDAVTGNNLSEKLRELYYAIAERDEETATKIFMALSKFWMLFQSMEHILLHDRSKNKADSKWFFDLQKAVILRYIFGEMKEVGEIPEHEVKLLQKAKVDWPELKVLVRSLQNNKTINENTEQQLEFLDYAEKALSKKETGWIREGLNELNDYIHVGGDPAQAIALADKHKEKIVKNILSAMKDGFIDYAKIAADILTTVGVTWPELKVLNRALAATKK